MRRFTLALFWIWIALAARLPGQDVASNRMARLAPVAPFPEVVAAARTNRIPVAGMDPLTETQAIDPGDSFTALVTLCEKRDRRTQWLIFLKAEAKESTARQTNTMVIYNTLGHTLEFASEPTPVSVRTLGPFAEPAAKGRPPKAADVTARFALDKGWLGLGLDDTAALILRLKQSKTNGPLASGTEPFPDDVTKRGRDLAETVQITAMEERAFSGTYPALLSYFRTVQETPGLEKILRQIVDAPSILSLVAHLGISSITFNWDGEHLVRGDPAAWGLPAQSRVYLCPMVVKLNNHPSLNLVLVVTAPRPPLLASAGVVAVLAEKPGQKDIYLTMRLVSARKSSPQPP